MIKLYTHNKSNFFKKVAIVPLFVCAANMQAQVQINGILHVEQSSIFYVATGNVVFGNTGKTTTNRGSNYGIIGFGPSVTTSNAGTSNKVDGYTRKFGTNTFLYPSGDLTRYAPTLITTDVVDDIDVAYFHNNPNTISAIVSGTIENLSENEFWDVRANEKGNITLTWRNDSDVSDITDDDLELLTIAGLNKNTDEWEQLVSVVDATSILGGASSLSAGSITTEHEYDLNDYSHFTLASKGICQPLVPFSGETVTWNGSSWSPNSPRISDHAVINADYEGVSFQCNSLELNADISLADNRSIEVVNGISGTGTITLASSAAIVQRNQDTDKPNIIFNKTTADVFSKRYVYWGTPVEGNFLSQMSGATAQVEEGEPITGAFDIMWQWVPGQNGVWSPLTTTTQGRGFITRVKPDQAPFIEVTDQAPIDVTFTGVGGNGIVNSNLGVLSQNSFNARNYNLLGNPYPSAIDGAKFMRFNSELLDGAIYMWNSNGGIIGEPDEQNQLLYSAADYFAWTLAGDNTLPDFPSFNGVIPSGQAFFVRALDAGTAEFNNCMRLLDQNDIFYRLSEDNELHETTEPVVVNRFKINLSNETEISSSTLIAYMDEASDGFDFMYDAAAFSSNSAFMFSFMKNTNSRLSINARPTFDPDDVVRLGMRKGNTQNETFKFKVYDREGIFATPAVKIFIHDKSLNVYHDVDAGDYAFSVNQTSIENRFDVVYQSVVMSNDDFEDDTNIFASISNELFTVQTNKTFESVELFDLTGRFLQEYKTEGNSTRVQSRFDYPESVYMARVNYTDGTKASVKLIARK